MLKKLFFAKNTQAGARRGLSAIPENKFDVENYISVLGAPQIDSPFSWKSKQEIMLQKDPLYFEAVKLMVDRKIPEARSKLKKVYANFQGMPDISHSVLYTINSKYPDYPLPTLCFRLSRPLKTRDVPLVPW
jgi:hypothetical protein